METTLNRTNLHSENILPFVKRNFNLGDKKFGLRGMSKWNSYMYKFSNYTAPFLQRHKFCPIK